MSQAAWKKSEQRLAALFGARRRPLSGGNQGGGRDDGMHPILFLENKHGKQCAGLVSLFEQTALKAKKEGRVPVIGVQAKYRGTVLIFAAIDFERVAQEWAIAHGYHFGTTAEVLTAIGHPPKKTTGRQG